MRQYHKTVIKDLLQLGEEILRVIVQTSYVIDNSGIHDRGNTWRPSDIPDEK